MGYKLFMLLLGSTPPGRLTEQHDIFFGIGGSLKELVPAINAFWPEAKGGIHIDVWREVLHVDGHSISIAARDETAEKKESRLQLFFINLGGYKKAEFDEFHYRMLVLAENKAAAISQSKASYFYKTYGYKEAPSHIDDKYGVDVDDIYELDDILPASVKQKFRIVITPNPAGAEDICVPGYTILSKLK